MKAIKVVAIVVIILVLIGIVGIAILSRGLDEVGDLTIEKIEASYLKDGTYLGEYDYGRWANKLQVTIRDGQILSIEILYNTRFDREDVTKIILERVLAEQTTDIDIVSGATVTTKAYLKAIENALTKAR